MDATSSVTKDGEVSENTKIPVAENKPEASLSDEISKQNKDTEVTQSSHANAADTNNSSTKIGVSDRKGEAKIKAQYLLLDYKPKIDTEFVAKETQNTLKHLNEENSENSSLEPPAKKLRLKGRNKKRPFERKLKACEKLCSSIIQEKECAYGPKCIFLHDVKAFWESKPEDIGPECHLFTKFGRCPYSFSCRFARHHISETLENMVNKEIYEGVPLSRNSVNHLDKDVQRLLWKRKYDFSKSQKVLEELNTKSSTNNVLEDGHKADMKKLDADSSSQNIGFVSDEDLIKLRPAEKKKIDFSNKLFLAPLTTAGNLPFRRLCKGYGADITCSEMAVATSLLQGKTEWALLKRHESEDIFGIQLCGAHMDSMTRCAQLIQENCKFDFVDINCGCPIELIYQKVSETLHQSKDLKTITPPSLRWRLSPLVFIFNTDPINDFFIFASVFQSGNGDVLSFEDANSFLSNTYAKGVMIARGALIKPWIFTEIKEQRHWDISSNERLDMLRQFVRNGFEHWGSDHQGVETTRRFLLEMLSFSHRYIPVGVLERVPQKINERPPYYVGRDELETLMSSSNCRDWIKISEMLLGPVTENFQFLPKHKANAYK
ncbi:tRNA-dihydrouridine(47) synthase [NAD(P)(+)]-like [Octopus bimaculoides]|uniref:tRNA-dihydrouridine(47) synthase [NAD(P)(+)]-like n=1 Tax=Octopus bimaculoides TaxID=37653 RepID=UPI0022E43E0F|nr:tRNA-dihydrouridine(47) synthase [NAD(P)(+)]-like [Octopus bimaculoides]